MGSTTLPIPHVRKGLMGTLPIHSMSPAGRHLFQLRLQWRGQIPGAQRGGCRTKGTSGADGICLLTRPGGHFTVLQLPHCLSVLLPPRPAPFPLQEMSSYWKDCRCLLLRWQSLKLICTNRGLQKTFCSFLEAFHQNKYF